MTIIYLPVVAHHSYDRLGHREVQTQVRLSPRPLDSEQALYLCAVAGRKVSDIGGAHAQRFALDQNGHHGLHDVEPLAVAVWDKGCQRFLRYGLRQDDVFTGVGEAGPESRQGGAIGRKRVARPLPVGLKGHVGGLEYDRRIPHPVLAEEVRHVQLAGRAGHRAYRGSFQIVRTR